MVTSPSLRIRFLLLLCGLSAACSLPATAGIWTEVPRPPGAHHASALEAGHRWLYAAWCIETGTTVALFRTPLASPGAWERLGLSARPIHDIVLLGAYDDTVFVAANSDTSVYRSCDGGHTWQIGDTGMPMESGHALAWSGTGIGRLLVEGRETGGAERRFISDDLGQSWSPVGSSFGVNYKPFLATPGDGSSLVYESVYGGSWTSRVSRSSDGGSSWQPLPGEFGTFVHDLDVHSSDPQCVCALMGGTSVPRWCGTTSLGAWPTPWNAVGVELPAWDPERAFLAGLDAQGRPVAAWREWEGTDWHAYGEGLPTTGGQGAMNQWLSFHLAAAVDEPLLFYATMDHGLWRREVTDLFSAVDDGDNGRRPGDRVVVMPNPARGAAQLRFSQDARLELFDASGRLVRWLATSGGEARWDGCGIDGRRLPAGVYLVRPVAGDATPGNTAVGDPGTRVILVR